MLTERWTVSPTRTRRLREILGRRKVRTLAAAASLIIIPLFVATRGVAETPKLSIKEADDACAHYAAMLISNSGDDKGVPEMKFKCEHHPDKSQCESTNNTIQSIVGIRQPLKCGQPVIVVQSPPPPPSKPSPPEVRHAVDPRVEDASRACDLYAATILAKQESQYVGSMNDWKARCEHDPVKGECLDTENTIKSVAGKNPNMTCSGVRVAALPPAPPLPPPPKEPGVGWAGGPGPLVEDADAACHYYSSAMIARVEDKYAHEMPNWKFRCEHHPQRSACNHAREAIQSARKVVALNCGS